MRPMDFIVDKNITEKTECERHFSCLQGDFQNTCKVDYQVGDIIFLGKSKKTSFCRYRIPFRISFFCSCPTRKAIRKTHGA